MKIYVDEVNKRLAERFIHKIITQQGGIITPLLREQFLMKVIEWETEIHKIESANPFDLPDSQFDRLKYLTEVIKYGKKLIL